MRRHLLATIPLALTLAASGILAPASQASAPASRQLASSELRPYPAKVAPLDEPWGLWVARYIQWYQEVPANQHPANKPNSHRNCEAHYGAVFMGPNGTGDGCTVPSGMPILLTFNGFSCSTAEGLGHKWSTLRHCTRKYYAEYCEDAGIRIRLDGQPLARPERWTFESTRRKADLPENNIWGVEPGPTRFLGKDQMLMLKPLAPGQHRFRIRVHQFGAVNIYKYPFTVVDAG